MYLYSIKKLYIVSLSYLRVLPPQEHYGAASTQSLVTAATAASRVLAPVQLWIFF